MAYDGMTVNEERARELFADRGRTSEAVLQQAAPALEVEGQLQHRLEGPADTGCAGVSHEQCASIDGAAYEAEADDGDEAGNAALPDEDFPEAALPAMNFCADAVTSGDMDEGQAIRKVHSELKELRDAVVAELQDDTKAERAPSAHALSLQSAVRALTSRKVLNRIVRAGDRADDAERGADAQLPCEAYAVHTGSKPLPHVHAGLVGQVLPEVLPVR